MAQKSEEFTLQEKDFIEIEFTGRIKDGEIFDSNIKEDLESAKLNIPAKPFIFCLGEGMFLKGVDEFLIGKKISQENNQFEIELPPEKAFGNRNSKLIQIIPMRVFREQRVTPVPGQSFNFDGRLAKILSVSGGRVITDFNNPLAGKTVIYKVRVLRKIEDLSQKIDAFIEFLFKRKLKFEVKDKKIILHVEKPFVQFAELFKDKFKSVFNMELEVKEISKAKKQESKPVEDRKAK